MFPHVALGVGPFTHPHLKQLLLHIDIGVVEPACVFTRGRFDSYWAAISYGPAHESR